MSNFKDKPDTMVFLPVSNGGLRPLPLEAGNVLVEVGQAPGHGLCYVAQLGPGHSVTLQVIRQRALPGLTHSHQTRAWSVTWRRAVRLTLS